MQRCDVAADVEAEQSLLIVLNRQVLACIVHKVRVGLLGPQSVNHRDESDRCRRSADSFAKTSM